MSTVEKLDRSNQGLLITFGCSWTVGEWLPGFELSPYVFSQYSWPAMLGKALNMEVMNKASGGNSNREILHDILRYDKVYGFHRNDLVIVCWSFFSRELLLDLEYTNQKIRTMDDLDDFTKSKFYGTHSFNDLEIRTREYVHHAECFFKSKNIKYKMGRIQQWSDKNDNWLIYNDEDLLLFEQVDNASDNAHPGIESNKRYFEKLLKEIND